ncbi:hypothetical protein, partial [Amycolatopsis mediterranei]|uniref:hypothetical protein n=1 Tax=Amycolatopsis mediterranei TaxID=33910 RepID=UPI00331A1F2B
MDLDGPAAGMKVSFADLGRFGQARSAPGRRRGGRVPAEHPVALPRLDVSTLGDLVDAALASLAAEWAVAAAAPAAL